MRLTLCAALPALPMKGNADALLEARGCNLPPAASIHGLPRFQPSSPSVLCPGGRSSRHADVAVSQPAWVQLLGTG